LSLIVGIAATSLVTQVEQANSQVFRPTFHESTSVQGFSLAKTGHLTFLIDVNVLGNSSGISSGTVQYIGEQDGLQMGIEAQCVKSFFLGSSRTPIVAIAAPVVSGSSQVTGKDKWVFIGIKDSNPDTIRFVVTSMQNALQLCNQPTGCFPLVLLRVGYPFLIRL